ncbi:cytochrome c oxidase assembly protein [Nakamurella sp. PAMC28650]|uniref:cytochrome c oxidase assembly protein n=1 Tax=Nakamurella sp. PAMC28650 TaxID=2762325 RepID=UPI00164D4CA4|nr:cytochrome c oxidase assembly protein [Nakamurella sp. PAMC28650]QNK80500.1 bifunctional copper resistance protein CopD/cytochrome c oxidase assembly protein [Nakamurella sp. PAMC28650]
MQEATSTDAGDVRIPDAPSETAAASNGPGGRWRVTVVAMATVVIGASVAVVLSIFLPSRNQLPGIPDSGQFTELLLAAMKGLFDLSAALTIGWLIAAVALAPPQKSGILDVGGYRALRAASLAAWVWTAVSLAMVPLTMADISGVPIGRAVSAHVVLNGLQGFTNVRGYLICAVIAALIALLSRIVLRPGWAFVLTLAALGALLPQALSGHASGSSDHDVAVDTMIFHLVGISIWIGGLLGFLGMVRQNVPNLPVVARRYSALALVAFVAVGISGIANAWIRLTYISDLWTTSYGRLVAVKFLALVTLGIIGFAHRKRTLPAIEQGRRRPLVRLASVELLIMGATVGVAAALGRTAPPPPPGVLPTGLNAAVEPILGFPLAGAPTISRLLFDWRFDYLLGTAVVIAAVLYAVGVRRLRKRGDAWPVGRTWAWMIGCFIVLIATSSGLGRYAQTQFSLHMISHMMLGMMAPILLVLGAPVTLALRALPVAGRNNPPGLREAIVATVHGRVARFLTHPLVVLPLFIGSFYAIYFTGLFADMIGSHFGHLLMSVHFLVVGYLYYWVIIGIDPGPRRVQPMVRLGLLLAALPFHAFFGLALMSSHTLLAPTFYRGLALPWVTDLLADQKLGGAIAWGATELPIIIVMIALLAQWAKSDDRENKRVDRHKDKAGDEELDAYNNMLAGMAGRSSPTPD